MLDTIFFCLIPFAAVAYVVLLVFPDGFQSGSNDRDSQQDAFSNAIDEEKDRHREEEHHRHQGW